MVVTSSFKFHCRQLNFRFTINTYNQSSFAFLCHVYLQILQRNCEAVTIFRTAKNHPSDIRGRRDGRGRFRPAVVHRHHGRRAPVHLLDVPRGQHHVRPRHHDDAHRHQGLHAPHCQRGPPAQGRLHVHGQKRGRREVGDCRVESQRYARKKKVVRPCLVSGLWSQEGRRHVASPWFRIFQTLVVSGVQGCPSSELPSKFRMFVFLKMRRLMK